MATRIVEADIYGHQCRAEVLVERPFGTLDIEVIQCTTCTDLVGKCFRISGLSTGDQK